MKILKLKLYQETACYKKPFATKVAETYPLPPYSTVIGMFHKILQAQAGQYFPMNVSVQGSYEGIFSNYQNLRKYKGKEVTSMPFNVHQLLNVNLIIHVQAEDEIIDRIYQNIVNGTETFTSLPALIEASPFSPRIIAPAESNVTSLPAVIIELRRISPVCEIRVT